MDEFRSLALTRRSDGMTADQTAEALLFNGGSIQRRFSDRCDQGFS
jgi:hypothetical protein